MVTEMRRDQNNITQNESFTVVFDTFLDRRNGLFFQTTPLGALRDQAIVDDVLNVNWNTVWDVRTGVFEGGWTAEFVDPVQVASLSESPGPQVWGINFRRVVKWKNEYSYLTAMPASYGTGQAIGRMGPAGTHGRPRDAERLEEPRAEAVRGCVDDHRSTPRQCLRRTTSTATPGSTSSTA